MRSDSDIKRDVEDELRWDPDVDSTDIAVTVKNGVVTLAGFTRSYSDKLEAEAAAKRVAGVVGLANDIEVRLPSIDQRQEPAAAGLRAAQGGGSQWMDHPRGRSRVGLSALRRRTCGAAGERGQGRHQFDPAQAARRADREQAENRGGVPPQCGNRWEPDHRRDTRRRGDTQRHGAVLGRTSGGGAGRVVRSGGQKGRRPDNDQCLNLNKGEVQWLAVQ